MCAVVGCARPRRRRDLCGAHHRRFLKWGDVQADKPLRPFRDIRAQLLSKIEKTDTCWLWSATKDRRGYGYVMLSGSRSPQPAYRAVYELLIGPIPEGLELDHLCRNPPCVNPDHLEPVTHNENMRRAGVAKTHCVHGHEYTPETTRIGSDGWRRCRTCYPARPIPTIKETSTS